MAGLLVEILGVNTGMIFGKYYYGNVLNPKILGTPLIIGLNWLFLVYVSTSIIDDLTINSIAKVFLASIIMVIYDVILEQVAGNLDMWYWYTDNIPLKNYISWFVIAVIFVSIIKFFKIETENKLSFTLLSTQFFFFLGLLIYFRAVQ